MDGVSLEALEHARNMTCQENEISHDTAQSKVAEPSPEYAMKTQQPVR